MKILFTGGGTMGPVTPLLAIYENLKEESGNSFLWIGTKNGPEKTVVAQAQIPYKSIPSGKLRRYFDWRNFTDPLFIFLGFLKSLWLIWRFKPDIILTAGSFVCVPVAYAGFVMRKKVVVHQQDLRVGLANRLMAPIASNITVVFDELLENFKKDKAILTGNPVRKFLFAGDKNRGLKNFRLTPGAPVVLVVGGGIGSEVINKLFIEASQDLTKFCQIIHVVGKSQQIKWLTHPLIQNNPRYRVFEFLTEDLADAYAVADLVVCRGGLGTLTEVAALAKPAIVIPIPKNQQVDNAEFFKKRQAIVFVRQEDLEREYLINLVRDLIDKPTWRQTLSVNARAIMPARATEIYVKLIKDIVANRDKIRLKKRQISD
jgi:UDP-N-acetylglucosamine--N-acetylmuramyl-(pentapeptide) pyrophosphoryl-undecaprenol N-acetylglucosamine transferase